MIKAAIVVSILLFGYFIYSFLSMFVRDSYVIELVILFLPGASSAFFIQFLDMSKTVNYFVFGFIVSFFGFIYCFLPVYILYLFKGRKYKLSDRKKKIFGNLARIYSLALIFTIVFTILGLIESAVLFLRMRG